MPDHECFSSALGPDTGELSCTEPACASQESPTPRAGSQQGSLQIPRTRWFPYLACPSAFVSRPPCGTSPAGATQLGSRTDWPCRSAEGEGLCPPGARRAGVHPCGGCAEERRDHGAQGLAPTGRGAPPSVCPASGVVRRPVHAGVGLLPARVLDAVRLVGPPSRVGARSSARRRRVPR